MWFFLLKTWSPRETRGDLPGFATLVRGDHDKVTNVGSPTVPSVLTRHQGGRVLVEKRISSPLSR